MWTAGTQCVLELVVTPTVPDESSTDSRTQTAAQTEQCLEEAVAGRQAGELDQSSHPVLAGTQSSEVQRQLDWPRPGALAVQYPEEQKPVEQAPLDREQSTGQSQHSLHEVV